MNSLAQLRRLSVPLDVVLNPRNYLIFAPTLVITSVLSNVRLDDAPGLTIWFLANVLALAIIYFAMQGLRILLGSSRRQFPVRILSVVLIGVLFGFFKTFLTLLSLSAFPDQTMSVAEALSRSILVAPLGITITPLVALIHVARTQYLANRDELINLRTAELQVADRPGAASARVRAELVSKIADEIQRVRARLQNGEAFSDIAEQARELRSLAELTVRPISQQLWADQARKLNDFSLGQLAKLGILKTPFAPAIFTLLLAPGLAIWIANYFGTADLLPRAIPALALVFMVLWVGSQLPVSSFKAGLFRFTATLSTAAVFAALWLRADTLFTEPFVALVLFITLAIWFFSNGFLIAIFRAGILAQAEIKKQLESALGAGALDVLAAGALSRYESRRVAQALHSKVQNQLLSAAMRLEESHTSKVDLEAELTLLEATVRNLSEDSLRVINEALIATIKRVAKQWQGFLAIEVEGDGELVPQTSTELIEHVVTEALSNAKRHGRASEVSFKVTEVNERIVLRIQDNGSFSEQSRPGLGFELFNLVSEHNFHYEGTASGTLLTIPLRIAGSASS